MNITIPSHLTDDALMAAAPRLAGDERDVAAQLVAHLAEIAARGLHVPAGYSSLYIYCREALGSPRTPPTTGRSRRRWRAGTRP